MEIGPVLLPQGCTHARNAHVTDVQYYGRRALSTKSGSRGRGSPISRCTRGWDQAGRTLVSASDITVAAPWQNWVWAVMPVMPRLVR
jgi:hypothetical protein